ncbi:BRcat domain-containing protein [Clostridium sp. Cult2]|uniref:BRcat domain-containing protein n=1 Tax=Clostridium sp. Cult2 TaxID=2079003 RepID=UPI001F46BF50|nr:zinc-ribbon domain-containing protein [Clostridium sp. Cult2]MCF6465330.1 hypothetical protein [Clostridium sp. Cult2]
MNWFRKFMVGRYGGDQLSMVLLIFSVLLTLIGQLTKIPLLSLIGYIPLGISIYRMFSKDISKRRMENYRFAMFVSPLYSRFKNIQNRAKDRKTNRYFKCPNCKSKLRLPKGKGKIMITCPKCNTKFSKRT